MTEQRRSLAPNLRRYMLQGLAVIVPLGITAFALTWLFTHLDGLIGRWLDPVLGWYAPGIGALVLILLLIIVGWLVEKALGRRLVALGERLLGRVPLVRRLYGGSSRIVKAVIGEEKMAFREAVLFEYPREGLWSIGLVTGRAPAAARRTLTDEGVTIYLPTAPNPMSGYLIIANRADVKRTGLSVEEVFTWVLSAGAVSTERAAELLEAESSQAPPPPPGAQAPPAPPAASGASG